MKNGKPTTIASGRVEDLLDAIAKPHVEHEAQGQTAENFDMSTEDEMQGQQRVEPMQSQDNCIRPDEGLRPQPAVEHGGGELPPQAPDGNPSDLAASVIPTMPPGSRKP
jgi:hypothetical protein